MQEALDTSHSCCSEQAVRDGVALVERKWTLSIVRQLLAGPRRFTDLRVGLPDLSANILSARLRQLADAGLVMQARVQPTVPVPVYELTGDGRKLAPVIQALVTWAEERASDEARLS